MSVKTESTVFILIIVLAGCTTRNGAVCWWLGSTPALASLPFWLWWGSIISADICQLCWIVSLALRAFLRVLQSFCLPKTNNSIDNFRVTSLSVKRLCITWRKGYSFISWHYLGYTVHWIICILLLFSHYQAQKDSPDIQWKVNWILYTVFLLTCLFKA